MLLEVGSHSHLDPMVFKHHGVNVGFYCSYAVAVTTGLTTPEGPGYPQASQGLKRLCQNPTRTLRVLSNLLLDNKAKVVSVYDVVKDHFRSTSLGAGQRAVSTVTKKKKKEKKKKKNKVSR